MVLSSSGQKKGFINRSQSTAAKETTITKNPNPQNRAIKYFMLASSRLVVFSRFLGPNLLSANSERSVLAKAKLINDPSA
jgi:hypothetical protein